MNKGSAYDSWARDLEAQDRLEGRESFGTQTDAVQAVLAGRADANVAGNTVIAWAVKNNPQLELSYLHSTGLVWAAALRKDSAELRKTIENAIECMKLDGTIAKMHEKWFGVKPRARLRRRHGVPGLRRARHGGLRSDRAHAAVQLTASIERLTRPPILQVRGLRKSFGHDGSAARHRP